MSNHEMKHPAYRLSESDLREALIETEREVSKMEEAILFYFNAKFLTEGHNVRTLANMTEAELALWSAAELTIHQFSNID